MEAKNEFEVSGASFSFLSFSINGTYLQVLQTESE